MKSCRVDPAHRIAGGNLSRGDVGRAVDRELQHDRQLGEINVVAFKDDVVPGRLWHHLAWNVFLAALTEGARQLGLTDAKAGRQEPPACRDIGDDRHVVAFNSFEHDDGTFAQALQLEHDRRHIEARMDGLADAQEFVGIFRLDHLQKATEALPVEIIRHFLHARHPLGL